MCATETESTTATAAAAAAAATAEPSITTTIIALTIVITLIWRVCIIYPITVKHCESKKRKHSITAIICSIAVDVMSFMAFCVTLGGNGEIGEMTWSSCQLQYQSVIKLTPLYRYTAIRA
ncbi:hypothetical protein GQX74_004446 [Glossina fuscipes]|nr:hypothetical protein GQX74_004446 [Glossina fuscipes]